MTDHPHPLAGAVKPLTFADETGDGVLTSRETGELYRVFPQSDGTFFAPKVSPTGYPTAEAAIAAINEHHKARILSALSAPTPPADVTGLVERLLIAEGDPEQIYYVDGLYNVCKEAAAALTTLSARVAELEAALQRTEANRDAAMQDAQEEHERAEAAEAALADARDALDNGKSVPVEWFDEALADARDKELARMQRMRDIYRQEWESARAREEIAATKAKGKP